MYFHLVNFTATDAFDLTAERILTTLDQIGYLDDYVRLNEGQSLEITVD